MKIAIIGAGLAGLTTARALKHYNVDIHVFEKSRGIGGRLANKRLDWGLLDIGAQYFTVRDPRFQLQVDHWLKHQQVAEWTFHPYQYKNNQLSKTPTTLKRYVGTPKMNTLAHALRDDTNIHLSTKIESLSLTPHGWQLHTSVAPIDAYFDWVILSAPAEQSYQLARNTALANQIPNQLHQPCWALALATHGKVRADIQGIFGDHLVSWVSRLSAQPGRRSPQDADDLWMLHFESTWSEHNPPDQCPDLARNGLSWLNTALSSVIDRPLTASHHYQHFWRYGRIDTAQHPPSHILSDEKTHIAAIGAWHEGGRIEGAYLSALNFIDYFTQLTDLKVRR